MVSCGQGVARSWRAVVRLHSAAAPSAAPYASRPERAGGVPAVLTASAREPSMLIIAPRDSHGWLSSHGRISIPSRHGFRNADTSRAPSGWEDTSKHIGTRQPSSRWARSTRCRRRASGTLLPSLRNSTGAAMFPALRKTVTTSISRLDTFKQNSEMSDQYPRQARVSLWQKRAALRSRSTRKPASSRAAARKIYVQHRYPATRRAPEARVAKEVLVARFERQEFSSRRHTDR